MAILLMMFGCNAPEPRSLLGNSLERQSLPDEVRMQRESALERARTIHAVHPEDEDAIIWLGRRTAYLGRYQEAVEIYSKGLVLLPESYRLLRHRGHRQITLRRLDEAMADLAKADQLSLNQPDTVEQDGMPNAAGKPRSTTKGNILYHLGLTRYLKGRFCDAAGDFTRCLELSRNDDTCVAASYWLYLSARRCGDERLASEALSRATTDMDLLENHAYLMLLLSFKGIEMEDLPESLLDAGVDDATLGYGKAMKFFFEGQQDQYLSELEQIVQDTNWAAFGHIAAEADLARD